MSRLASTWRVPVGVATGVMILLSVAGLGGASSSGPANYGTPETTPVTHVETTITLGCDPDTDAVNPATDTVYVTCAASDRLVVIHGATNTVVKTVHLSGAPIALAYDPVHGQIYVALYGPSDHIDVISASDYRVTSVLSLGGYPTFAIYVPGHVYIMYAPAPGVGSRADHVEVVNTTTRAKVAVLRVGSYPCAAAYDPRNGELYVQNCLSNTVSAIRVSDHRVISTFPGGLNLGCMDFDSKNGNLYLANYDYGGGSTVTVIDAASHAVVTTIGVGASPRGCAFNPESNRLYIGNAGEDDVSVIDPFTESVVRTVAAGAAPAGEVFDPINEETYVCDASTNTVTVLAA
jgi:YVTN family beta-propeller protein